MKDKYITKECKKHGLTEYIFVNSEQKYRCVKCRSEAVQKRRDKTKQILIEYKEQNNGTEKQKKKKIDYRASLKTEEQKVLFDKLKAVRLELAKSKNLKAAYLVCKDEHLAVMVQNPNITEEEIKNLPNANNILLKDFAYGLYTGYQKILEENQNQEKLSENKDEESQIPF